MRVIHKIGKGREMKNLEKVPAISVTKQNSPNASMSIGKRPTFYKSGLSHASAEFPVQ